MPSTTSRASPVSKNVHLPEASLISLLTLLTLSHFYIQLAQPLHGIVVAFGIAVLGAIFFLASSNNHSQKKPYKENENNFPKGTSLYQCAIGFQIAWLVWNGIALLRAPVISIGRPAFGTVFLGFIVFWIAAESTKRWSSSANDPAGNKSAIKILQSLSWISHWLILLGTLLALYAVYQVMGPQGWPRTITTQYHEYAKVFGDSVETDVIAQGVLHALQEQRAFSTFGAPNIFAGFLILVLVGFLGMFFFQSSKLYRGFLALGFFLASAALILSQSRGGILAAICAALWFLFRYSRISLLLRKTVSLSVVLALVLLALNHSHIEATTSPPISKKDTALTQKPNRLQQRLLSVGTIRERAFYYQTASMLWSENRILGSGLGGFETHYPRLRRDGAQETIFAHNWVLQYGSETGIVGSMLFLGCVGFSFFLGAKALSNSKHRRPLLLVLECGALGLLIHGLVDYTLSQRELYLDFQLFLGALIGSGTIILENKNMQTQETVFESQSFLPWKQGWQGWSKWILVLFGVWVLFQQIIFPMLSKFYATESRFLTKEKGYTSDVLALERLAAHWEPDNPKYQASLGMTEIMLGNINGIERISQATRENPYSASLQQMLAYSYERVSANELALEYSQKAVELHPLNPDHRLALAERLLRFNRNTEAQEHLQFISQRKLHQGQRKRLERLEEQIRKKSK